MNPHDFLAQWHYGELVPVDTALFADIGVAPETLAYLQVTGLPTRIEATQFSAYILLTPEVMETALPAFLEPLTGSALRAVYWRRQSLRMSDIPEFLCVEEGTGRVIVSRADGAIAWTYNSRLDQWLACMVADFQKEAALEHATGLPQILEIFRDYRRQLYLIDREVLRRTKNPWPMSILAYWENHWENAGMPPWLPEELERHSAMGVPDMSEPIETSRHPQDLPERFELIDGRIYTLLLAASEFLWTEEANSDAASWLSLPEVRLWSGRYRVVAQEERPAFERPEHRSFIGVHQETGAVNLLIGAKGPGMNIFPLNSSLVNFGLCLQVYQRFAAEYWEGELVSLDEEAAQVDHLALSLRKADPNMFRKPLGKKYLWPERVRNLRLLLGIPPAE